MLQSIKLQLDSDHSQMTTLSFYLFNCYILHSVHMSGCKFKSQILMQADDALQSCYDDGHEEISSEKCAGHLVQLFLILHSLKGQHPTKCIEAHGHECLIVP